MNAARPAHRLSQDPAEAPLAIHRRPLQRAGWQRVARRAASAALIVVLSGVPMLAQEEEGSQGGQGAASSEAARDHARPDKAAQQGADKDKDKGKDKDRAGKGEARGRGNEQGGDRDEDQGNPAEAYDEAHGETPIISSDDEDVADAVMDGPSEPAAAVPDDWNAMQAAEDALPQSDLMPEALSQVLPGAAQMFPSGNVAGRAGKKTAAAAIAPVPAAATAPVVVELFTAQGCASCPPADALLAEMAARPDVLPLAFHVDYWDYLGWRDAFARPEFTARQQAYGRSTGERAIYTPQMIVGGTDTLINLSPAALEGMIEDRRAAGSPIALTVQNSGGRIAITLGPGASRTGPARVDLVRYLPRREVRITAGENRGRTAVYRNIVVSVETLARWDGRSPLQLTVTPGAGKSQPLPADTRHAVLVQQEGRARGLGQILAAVPID